MYVLTCNQCKNQYVGQTANNFWFRWNNYNCSCRKNAQGQVLKQQHFNGHFRHESDNRFISKVPKIYINMADPLDPFL